MGIAYSLWLPPMPAGSRWHVSQTHVGTENIVEHALQPVQLLFYLLSGLGLFFLGVGALWFVSVYKDKEK